MQGIAMQGQALCLCSGVRGSRVQVWVWEERVGLCLSRGCGFACGARNVGVWRFCPVLLVRRWCRGVPKKSGVFI